MYKKDNEKYWCAFTKLKKVSSRFIYTIYKYFGSIELAWNAEAYDLWKIEGLLKRSIESFIEERRTVNPQECLDTIKENNIGFIHLEHSEYPELLRNIDNPPIGLFILGNLKECNLERTLAIVGSRRASENGKNALKGIISGFANSDICIVSGLAEGIDTVAHKSAVEHNIKTIAVIGGGFNKIYPKSNIGLFNKIIKENHGAIISEYWMDDDALSWHFPVRNRIVSGLSKGILVAEAAIKSGAMITANLALEQGRELMCMPGLISNPNTQGVYKLLKNGASMVTCTEDILDAMNWQIDRVKESDTKQYKNLTKEEKEVIESLKIDTLTIDELAIKTNLNINDLMVILTKLELDGVISQTSGEKYIITN